MPSDLLPASALFHPCCGKTEMLGPSGVWHLSAPHHRFAASRNHGIPINTHILNLPVVGNNHQEPEPTIPSTICLFTNLFNGLVTTKSSDHKRAKVLVSFWMKASPSTAFSRRTSCSARRSQMSYSNFKFCIILAGARFATE
jgi:hypothetical protein